LEFFGWLERTDTQREQLDTKAVSLMEAHCARGALVIAAPKTGRILLSLLALFSHFCWPLLRLRL